MGVRDMTPSRIFISILAAAAALAFVPGGEIAVQTSTTSAFIQRGPRHVSDAHHGVAIFSSARDPVVIDHPRRRHDIRICPMDADCRRRPVVICPAGPSCEPRPPTYCFMDHRCRREEPHERRRPLNQTTTIER